MRVFPTPGHTTLHPAQRDDPEIPVSFQLPKPSISPVSKTMPLSAFLCQVYRWLVASLVAAKHSFYRPQMRLLRGNFS